jgi:hypothetical protein
VQYESEVSVRDCSGCFSQVRQLERLHVLRVQACLLHAGIWCFSKHDEESWFCAVSAQLVTPSTLWGRHDSLLPKLKQFEINIRGQLDLGSRKRGVNSVVVPIHHVPSRRKSSKSSPKFRLGLDAPRVPDLLSHQGCLNSAKSSLSH